jgi:uncharacterized protein (DUF433 family)
MTKDGQVFLFGLDARGTEEMIKVLTQQRVFPDILLPFLRKMDYDEATEMDARWCIANMVVIDPKIGFGKPTIDGVGINTAVLAASYEANDRDAERVADWFKVQSAVDRCQWRRQNPQEQDRTFRPKRSQIDVLLTDDNMNAHEHIRASVEIHQGLDRCHRERQRNDTADL